MKIIVGLVNPESKYKDTRHTAGFIFVDRLAAELLPDSGSQFNLNKKFEAEIAECSIGGEKIILVKPMTYMNRSGEAVSKITSFYKADISDLAVALDDKDLPLGHVRIRPAGSSAGHKGLQNIIDLTGSDAVARIRIGIAQESGGEVIDQNKIDTADFVLSKFTPSERKVLDESVEAAAKDLVLTIKSNEAISAHSIDV